MLKTMSAALLAVSVLVAPAFAAESAKTTADTPVIKSSQAKISQAKSSQVKTTPADSALTKSTQGKVTGGKVTDGKVTDSKTVQPTAQAKPDALNSNAKMGKHHRKHVSYRHRHHGKMAASKAQPGTPSMAPVKSTSNGAPENAPKLGLKPAASNSKRS